MHHIMIRNDENEKKQCAPHTIYLGFFFYYKKNEKNERKIRKRKTERMYSEKMKVSSH